MAPEAASAIVIRTTALETLVLMFIPSCSGLPKQRTRSRFIKIYLSRCRTKSRRFAKNFRGVLTKSRGRPAQRAGRSGQLRGDAKCAELTCRGMLGLDHHLARDNLRVCHRFIKAEDRAGWNTGLFESAQPIRGWLLFETSLQNLHQHVVVLDAVGVGREPRIANQFSQVENLAKAHPEVRLRRSDRNAAVLG